MHCGRLNHSHHFEIPYILNLQCQIVQENENTLFLWIYLPVEIMQPIRRLETVYLNIPVMQVYVYIQGVSSCGTECALVGDVRCSVHRLVATRQPQDCVPHGGRGHSPLCSGAGVSQYVGPTLFLHPVLEVELWLIWRSNFIRFPFDLNLTWIKESLPILSP